MNIKVGDEVQSVGYRPGLTGVVTRIREGVYVPGKNWDGGTVEVKITHLTEEYLRKSSGWRPVGAKEFFILEGWEKVLRIL